VLRRLWLGSRWFGKQGESICRSPKAATSGQQGVEGVLEAQR
jgi:hypothetical protein